jgi:hypothetical protein
MSILPGCLVDPLAPDFVAAQSVYRQARGDPNKKLPYGDYINQHIHGPHGREPLTLGGTEKMARCSTDKVEAAYTSNLSTFFTEPFNLRPAEYVDTRNGPFVSTLVAYRTESERQ